MSDSSIRKDFVEGTYEIFTTLFNEAKTPDDGVQFFKYLGGEESIYEEHKFKKYGSPITLVAKVQEPMQDGTNEIEKQKRHAIFTVPIKSLTENGVDSMNKSTVSEMRKGIMKCGDVFYYISLIQGKAFVENVYLFWEFHCVEVEDLESICVEIEDSEVITVDMEDKE